MASREPSRTPPGSVADAYEYDPKLRLDQQVGLDRLRCIPDRKMAAALHALYLAISEKPRERTPGAEGTRKRPGAPDFRKVEILAARAFAGELGFEANELAQ